MTIDLLLFLSQFEIVSDRESETAYFRTHVPWVAELAYLHIVFKPLDTPTLREGKSRLDLPSPLVDLLTNQNGAILFSGALSVYGVHPVGQLLNRDDPFLSLPFNIETENDNPPPVDRHRYLAIGGYGFDGSHVCMDRRDYQVYLFQRYGRVLATEPSYRWRNIEDWIVGEIGRLSTLFDKRGNMLVGRQQTLPYSAFNA